MEDQSGRLVERGVLSASDAAWAVAVERAAVIGRLVQADRVTVEAADGAAAELGISRRRVYALVRRWREGSGLVSDLLVGRSGGGRGGGRLPEAVEMVVRETLRSRYLSRQRRSLSAVHREIARTCKARGLPVPSRGALERRVAQLDPVQAVASREGRDAARALQSAGGVAPVVDRALAQVQMDHTVVDVVVVDERHRLPIGRPYVTVAIDVFSRAVVGLVVTLEAPSALSVGLCLVHMVIDKRVWLEQAGVDAVWPMAGKPAEIYVDNAAEFHGEALMRGCTQHGIGLRWRPPGQPHYGGVVERVIGTFMQQVHELPGTTFSRPAQRAGYDSDARAALTLAELERWLALAVAVYHGEVHATLGRTPGGVWAEATTVTAPVVVSNAAAFLVDFLPMIRRTITRTGFQIDHVQYFSDALKPWIARREQLGRFVIRRDPRDISRIWVLDPDGSTYLKVGYRTLARPPISVWEQRAAVARLREQGRAQVDEDALFRMIEQMRAITDTAVKTTRKTRRDAERRTAPVQSQAPAAPAPPPSSADAGALPAAPFDVIEEW